MQPRALGMAPDRGAKGRTGRSADSEDFQPEFRQFRATSLDSRRVWVRKVAARYALTEVPLDSSLCSAAALLPLLHRDPCDRFIIAAAYQLHTPVVTIDPKFGAYGVEVVV